ncbi:PilC/PilY family type IV pilus protein [Pseudomonas sp. F1_0610]|uniref:pilus assembly protein n=1 Tax=Pseudomonas sp. F1_0610 TaxID=3114284 RepID=UPI0039C1DE6B
MIRFNYKLVMALLVIPFYSPYGMASVVSSFEPSQSPLDIKETVAPNLVLTIDSSASMNRDYTDKESDASYEKRSHDINKLAFNVLSYMDPKGDSKYELPWIALTDDIYARYPSNDLYKIDKGKLYVRENGYIRGSNRRLITAHFQKFYIHHKSCTQTHLKKCYTEYTLDLTRPDHVEQFAIWYAFYRTRGLQVKTTINLAMANLPEEVRVSWQDLYKCPLDADCKGNKYPYSSYTRPAYVKRFEKAQKRHFFEWLNDLDFAGGSALNKAMNRAGLFFRKERNYASDKEDHTFLQTVGCRQNFHMMFTDTETTDSGWYDLPDVENGGKRVKLYDWVNEDHIFPDEKYYSGSMHPYQSGKNYNRGSIANVAFFYWSTDLLPNVDNNLIPYMEDDDYWHPKNDPATWQHMVNFMVGLGLKNRLSGTKDQHVPVWEPNAYRPSLAFIYKYPEGNFRTTTWPRDRAYELWHAAIASRGEFFNAEDKSDVQRAFDRLTARLESKSNSRSQPMTVVSSTRSGEKSSKYFFQTMYSTKEGWTGDLQGSEEVPSGSTSKGVSWSLSARLSATNWNARNIKVAGSTGKMQKFDWNNLSDSQKAALNTHPDSKKYDGYGPARIEFIKGSQDYANGKTFPPRKSKLGDILNSKPVFVKDARYLVSSISWSADERSSYKAFQVDRNAKRSPYVYVGANDGMLHGVNVNTGFETFAYIPKAVIPYLNKLTSPIYGVNSHRYYVDGKIVVADAYYNNSWHTVLLGTLGAGGKGIFALDITDPKADGSGVKLLWDLDQSDFAGTKSKLGYSYSTPSVVRFADGSWKVVFGNGPAARTKDEANGYASLFVVDLATGKIEREYAVRNNQKTSEENGLFTPTVISTNGNGVADVAYAGDLQGNLWRFDLTDTGAKENNTPLYTAIKDGHNQSITSAPLVVRHPKQDGFIVSFGTGRYFTAKDTTLFGGQDFYGIWDPRKTPSASHPGTIQPRELVTQSINKIPSQKLFTITQNKVSWANWDGVKWNSSSTAEHKGWRLLLRKDEAVVSDAIKLGNNIVFQAILPNSNACEIGTESRLYAINPFTGGGLDYGLFANWPAAIEGAVIGGMTVKGASGGISLSMTPMPTICTSEVCFKMNLGEIGRQTWRRVE